MLGGLSAVGVVVALFNRLWWSVAAYIVLTVASFALLFTYRLFVVAATRAVDADASVVGIKARERWAILAVVAACLANGVVLGLAIGSLEYWF